MKDCPYCKGTGTQYVESGSSLSYDCPDCNGSGYVPECPACGREYYGDFCEDCYGVCACCEDIERLEHLDDDNLCEMCSDNVNEAVYALAMAGWYTGNLTRVQLGDICRSAYAELREWTVSFPKGEYPNIDKREQFWVGELISKAASQGCTKLSKLTCGFCGQSGISVSFLGCEKDSDGEFENWNAECIHCGKRSVDMDDPNSAIDIITNGEKGEIVNVG